MRVGGFSRPALSACGAAQARGQEGEPSALCAARREADEEGHRPLRPIVPEVHQALLRRRLRLASFKAQGMAEADLKPTARSRVGARGIMQLMPSTYQMIQSARPDFSRSMTRAQHRRGHHARPLSLDAVAERSRRRAAALHVRERTTPAKAPIKRARAEAAKESLDAELWTSVEAVAPKVKPWRYRETLGYVKTIDANRLKLRRSGTHGRRP